MKNLFCLFLCTLAFMCRLSEAQTFEVSSPGQSIRVRINTDDEGSLQYAVNFSGRQIIENSKLGFVSRMSLICRKICM
jgi:hypothetical protein